MAIPTRILMYLTVSPCLKHLNIQPNVVLVCCRLAHCEITRIRPRSTSWNCLPSRWYAAGFLFHGPVPLKPTLHPSELKELINMHSAIGPHGGDLQSDTITMVGGALDFQVTSLCILAGHLS